MYVKIGIYLDLEGTYKGLKTFVCEMACNEEIINGFLKFIIKREDLGEMYASFSEIVNCDNIPLEHSPYE